MNDLGSIIRSSAEHQLGDEWVPDWGDVLGRAGRPRHPRTALLCKRAGAIGGLVALTLALTLPGIGIGGRLKDLIAGSRAPGIELRAGLTRPDGRRIGVLSLRTSRLFVAVSSRTGRVRAVPFVPRGRGPLQPQQFRWTLDLEGASTVASARIERGPGKVIARLCAPCHDGDQGTVRVGRSGLQALFGRHAVVAVETSGGLARGVLRLRAPMRRS